MLEFEDKLYWNNISLNQKLSLYFIKENIGKLNIGLLLKNYKISNYAKNKLKLLDIIK